MVSRKANKDLHSKYGAVVENPAWELVWTLSKIKTKEGDRIVIPRWYEDVRPLTDEEKKILESQPFAEEDFKKSVGISKFINDLLVKGAKWIGATVLAIAEPERRESS